MLKIIPANKNNLEETAYLFNQYRIFYNMPSNIKAAKTFISARLTKQDSFMFIAFSERAAVGFVQIYNSFSSVAMQPIWILNDLYILENARHKGYARKIMNYLHEKAVQENIFSIKLATSISNYKAKALYNSLGYQLNEDYHHYSKRVGLD